MDRTFWQDHLKHSITGVALQVYRIQCWNNRGLMRSEYLGFYRGTVRALSILFKDEDSTFLLYGQALLLFLDHRFTHPTQMNSIRLLIIIFNNITDALEVVRIYKVRHFGWCGLRLFSDPLFL